ncbi:DUF3667 domain-containing protein [Flavobacterium sp.]|uniref:DUF3667 domain-containing protein n=1 Tax=Flavobacterium sp. TaxID=239 RepID=UPI0028BEDBF2|nr:DUF3667 domain-containing protein [Flavobacterium sp.]
MSESKLRDDKTCLNCGNKVESRFCPECGQENTESRKSFHYLFTHFVEDLVHYDSSFWKTIKFLLFRPARLTKEYLAGKRASYVAPVKLYIFISFLTFFTIGIISSLPDEQNQNDGIKFNQSNNRSNISFNRIPELTEKEDSIQKADLNKYGWYQDYKSVAQYDSIQNALPEQERKPKLIQWIERKIVAVSEHNTSKELKEKFTVLIKKNISKALFLYMPIFAFWLWLFHGKKRWYYFEHGIFTLHYFSFLLLSTGLMVFLDYFLSMSDFVVFNILQLIMILLYIFYPIVYFYKAHKRMYMESKSVSFLKSSILFIINSIFITIFTALLIIYTTISIH